MPGQKPVAKFKAGQVSAAIWANSIPVKNGGTATILKATVQRRYKDNKDGQSFYTRMMVEKTTEPCCRENNKIFD